MVVYGYLLKQQFDSGNFVQNVYKQLPKYSFRALTPFRHVVVDGNLYIYSESPLTQKLDIIKKNQPADLAYVQWDKVFGFSGAQKEVGYSVLAGYEDIVKTKIKNDTLYVTFFKSNGEDLRYAGSGEIVSINNKEIISLDLNNGFYSFNKITGQKLTAKVKNAGLKIGSVNFDTFHVSADNANSIDIDSSTISLFQYSLHNHSKLNLENNKITTFQKLSLDSLSKISVQGYAINMEKFLPALTY